MEVCWNRGGICCACCPCISPDVAQATVSKAESTHYSEINSYEKTRFQILNQDLGQEDFQDQRRLESCPEPTVSVLPAWFQGFGGTSSQIPRGRTSPSSVPCTPLQCPPPVTGRPTHRQRQTSYMRPPLVLRDACHKYKLTRVSKVPCDPLPTLHPLGLIKNKHGEACSRANACWGWDEKWETTGIKFLSQKGDKCRDLLCRAAPAMNHVC